MTEHIPKCLLVLFAVLALMVVSAVLAGQVATEVAAQTSESITRDLEPVVVKGSQVGGLIDTPVEDLFVYTFSGNSLSGQIPVQVDELAASGMYTTTEDSLLDANDEIVFMAVDLGDRPTDPTELTSTLPISATWYEIQVTDPLRPTQKGWAYLVRSSELVHIGDDYVNYNTETRRITTTANRYTLGLAGTFLGLDYLALNGSNTDILDRTKLRAVFDVLDVPTTITEDDLGSPEIVPIRDGSVRVIVQQAVIIDLTSAGSEASLNTTNLAYASMLQGIAGISFTLPSYVDFTGVRTSVDFNNNTSGATLCNANMPGGVTMDGSPDVVAATPLSHWAQVSHSTGRLIQVSDLTPAGGMQTNYYCDDNTSGTECGDPITTGDGVSYGDAGILIEGNVNRDFTIATSLFILPSGEDSLGSPYEDYFFNPLQVVASLNGQPPIYLPLVHKNSR